MQSQLISPTARCFMQGVDNSLQKTSTLNLRFAIVDLVRKWGGGFCLCCTVVLHVTFEGEDFD